MYTIAELSFIKDIPLCISKMEQSDETVKIEFDMPFSLSNKDKNIFKELKKRMYSEELFHINFFNYINDTSCKKFDDVAIDSIKFVAQVEDCVVLELSCSGWWQDEEVRVSPIVLDRMLAILDSDLELNIYNEEKTLPQFITHFEFVESKHNEKTQGKIEYFNGFIGRKEKVENFFDFNKKGEQFNIDVFYEINKTSVKSDKFKLLNLENADFRFHSKTVHKGFDKIVFNFSR